MHLFDAARLLALQAVLLPDDAYVIRKALRDYSARFHCPLPDVYSLPLEHVLQHVWEARYEDLQGQEVEDKDPDNRPYIERERERLCETDTERHAREKEEREEEMDEDDLVNVLRKENEKVLAAAEKLAAAKPLPDLKTVFDEEDD